jgi:uracil-DNA glycosylase
MTWDPRDLGAKCDECPLGPHGTMSDGPWAPVAMEDHSEDGAFFIVVGDSPSKEDAIEGRPFSHSEGGTLMRAMRTARLKRPQASYTNVIACRLPGKASGAYKMLTDKIKKVNKKRQQVGDVEIPHPVECCRPRLEAELDNYVNIVTLGKLATNELTGISRGIAKVRGSPWGINPEWKKVAYDNILAVKKLLPTFHPRYIQRAPNRFHVWASDIRKAYRLFTDTLDWEDPIMFNKPTPDEAVEWFMACKETQRPDGSTGPILLCYDVETNRHRQGMRPTSVTLRTIAFARWKDGIEGNDVECLAIPFLSTDGVTRFYSGEDEYRMLRIIKWVMLNPGFQKMGHNAGQFDRLVMEEFLRGVE